VTSPLPGATVSVEVPVDALTAFRLFTEDFDAWWKRALYSWNDPGRAVAMRFESGVGGRWVEVWDAGSGEGLEIGRVLVWEPGRRLVFSHNILKFPDIVTEVEVTFEASPSGTKVTLRHYGWQDFPLGPIRDEFEGMRRGWASMLDWYKEFAARAAGGGDD
jgi:hypothetical protein